MQTVWIVDCDEGDHEGSTPMVFLNLEDAEAYCKLTGEDCCPEPALLCESTTMLEAKIPALPD